MKATDFPNPYVQYASTGNSWSPMDGTLIAIWAGDALRVVRTKPYSGLKFCGRFSVGPSWNSI